MKALRDPDRLLGEGLAAIRAQFRVPAEFPAAVLAEAEAASHRTPDAHVDWTDRAFVTLDPASSTDLDQAFAIEAAGNDWLLHYAIADVAWFVAEGGALDAEAWARGTTAYLPDGKASLYPPVLSERAASLLPDGPRPSVVLTVRVDATGAVRLDAARRAVIRSRAKLGYETVRDAELPAGFAEIATRIALAEDRRGAVRIDPPEQEVSRDADGRYVLRLRPYTRSEEGNATLSLAANLAVADALYAAGTGLFRVMPPPDARAERRLRATAKAFELDWPKAMLLAQFERRLRSDNPRDAAFMLAVRRASNGASYQPYHQGELPWHAAMAATYAHCTAPLRRLADRYVLRAVLAVANGEAVPDDVSAAFARLPRAMARAGSRDGQIDRAVIDLAEAAMLTGHEGDCFPAVVTDRAREGASIQLCDLPIIARVDDAGLLPGDRLTVRLTEADVTRRRLAFVRES